MTDYRRTIGERVYRLLLHLLPRSFREQFQLDLLDLFRDGERDAAARGGIARIRFWAALVSDLAAAAIGERLSGDARRRTNVSNTIASNRGGGMQGVSRDLRYALRMMGRRPTLSAVIVITLALGIGVNTAIFSVVNTVLLRPLPYEDPDRLARVWEHPAGRPDAIQPVRPGNFFDWKARVRAFEDIAWSRDAIFNITGEGRPESVMGYRFSANMLDVLGVQPRLGRAFRPEDDRPGGARVALLSDRLWQRRYGGSPGVLGRTITLNGESYTIVGVMGPEFRHPASAEIWAPVALTAAEASSRERAMLRLIGRLKPGVTRDQAATELAAAYESLARAERDAVRGLSATLEPMGDRGDAPAMLAVLFGAVGFVLLIACVNVAQLLLADATSRQREVAVRAALGASRARVARQLLTESTLLAVAGGVLGALGAWWTSDALVALFPQNVSNLNLPSVERVEVDARVFGFAMLLSVATGLVFGLLPALKVSRIDMQGALKSGDRGGTATRRTHAALVVTEVALSIVLLAGALLMVQSFVRLQRVDLGLKPEGVLTARLLLPGYRYADDERIRRFSRRVVEELRAVPGVDHAGLTNFLPLSGWWGTRTFTVEGQPDPAPGAEPSADARAASEDYFRTLGVRLIAGRTFTDRDTPAAAAVVIVNQTLADRYWPGQNPVGRRVVITENERRVTLEVVGVIEDVRSFGLEEDPHAEMFRPLTQEPWPLLGITVRSRLEPASLAAAVREAVWRVDPDQPLTHVLPMSELAAEHLAFRRVSMMLAGAFSLLALALAAIGIYAVSSYSVTRRTREMGVRLALGATPRGILRLVLREALLTTSLGVVIGLTAAAALTRYLTSLLFEVRPADPVTFGAVAATLLVLSLVATWLPAWRACRVDPTVALRME